MRQGSIAKRFALATAAKAALPRCARLALAACAALVLALSAAAPASAAFGILHSFGPGQGSRDGEFNQPEGVATDAAGNIYVADTYNHRVQKFNSAGAFVGKWGSQGAGDGQFDVPSGIVVAGGAVYVADYGNSRIQRFSSTGAFLGKFGTFGAGAGQLAGPRGVAADAAGNLYVADDGRGKIVKFTSAGAFVAEFGTKGSADGQFASFGSPWDVAVDGAGNIYAADTENHRIQKFNPGGGFLAKWGSQGAGDGQFETPRGLATDAAGTVYVADSYNNRIQRFTSAGTFLGKFGGPNTAFPLCEGQFSHPEDVDADAAGRVYVTDTFYHRIQVFGQGGAPIPRCAGSMPPSGGAVNVPTRGAPTISRLSLTRRAFCIGRRCPARRRGTTLRFRLSQPAFVNAKVERRLAGLRVAGRCRRASRRNRRGPRCTLYDKAGSFGRVARAGATSIPFSGRIGGRALRPSSYRLTVRATGADEARSRPAQVRFRVVTAHSRRRPPARTRPTTQRSKGRNE